MIWSSNFVRLGSVIGVVYYIRMLSYYSNSLCQVLSMGRVWCWISHDNRAQELADRLPVNRISSNLNGGTNKFGWLRASATAIDFLSIISRYAASIGMDSARAHAIATIPSRSISVKKLRNGGKDFELDKTLSGHAGVRG